MQIKIQQIKLYEVQQCSEKNSYFRVHMLEKNKRFISQAST